MEKAIILKHLLINEEKCIGLQFYPNPGIESIVKSLPTINYSDTFGMYYVKNTKANFSLIFNKFKGIAWINTNSLFTKGQGKSAHDQEKLKSKIDHLKQNEKVVPQAYLDKLTAGSYAYNTYKTYVSLFSKFILAHKNIPLMEITEFDIQDYLLSLQKEGKSDSLVNQSLNAIKFYYEKVEGMPNRFYAIQRPRNKHTLPKVLSKPAILNMIQATENTKHKCIIALLYSSGLRRGELLNLKIGDIDSERMTIRVNEGKGFKDRVTILDESILLMLRTYYKEYKPKHYLFEGSTGEQYSATSVGKIISKAAKRAKIQQKVTPHMLRHSFATHLLEEGTNLRIIQTLLGHESSKTTETYTYVAKPKLNEIRSLLTGI